MRTIAELQAERAEALAPYTVRDGIIQDAGKFEGEAQYVPYFWYGEPDPLDWPYDETTYLVMLDSDDVRMWPELEGIAALHMRESDQGFVSCEALTRQGYHDLAAYNNAIWEDEQFNEED